jgi:UDP-glucose 4-epimerase
LKVLVTGGAGFIGSHLTERLVTAGHKLYVLDNFSTGRMDNLSGIRSSRNLKIVKGDIRRIHRALTKMPKRIDAICHLAAVTSVQQSIRKPILTTEVNLTGTLQVLEAARKLDADRVVFASSAAVYGTPRAFPIREDANISPISPYGASKAASELYLRAFEENHKIEAVSLRYFNVYGPRQTPNQYAGVISKFVRRALQQKTLEIYGDGSQTRDFIYVSDVVDATVAALEKNLRDRVFNIASGTETTILELAKTIQRIAESRSELKFCPPQTGDIARSIADTTKAQNEMGSTTRTPLHMGLSATTKWLAETDRARRADRHTATREPQEKTSS